MTDKSRITNVLQFRSPLDRIATLSGPDQAQRACDEVAYIALDCDGQNIPIMKTPSLPYVAPESDPA